MLKAAEDLRTGDIIAVNSRPYRITVIRRSFDAVWADAAPAAGWGLEIPTRHTYGAPVAVARAAGRRTR